MAPEEVVAHSDALLLLSDLADAHFQGVQQALRHPLVRPRVPRQSQKKLRQLEVSYHFMRHVSAPLIRQMRSDIGNALRPTARYEENM